ncbi:hypothetical protein [Natronorubrum daqingense]|uniref:Bacteriorhodopsin n=1 Tax=Natronorubrum daqingense TaxID=588898 RepID=A0A1N7CPA7_9EURY|nr:hypothetical protein [Natronorubrum daqingense]APX96992.1 hypothetical protein BB347_10375 [Natronorubrum daqingense]SIR65400.1 hypothetical protein SAMN05421809_1806 [Natronorubrum daqingense]
MLSLLATSTTFDANDPETTVAIGHLFASLAIALGALVLLYYTSIYVRDVLAADVGGAQWYLSIGLGAAVVYAGASIGDVFLESAGIPLFGDGAILFCILFLTLAIRAMYHAERTREERSQLLPAWADVAVIAIFVVAWWGTFLLESAWTRPVVAVGWVLASAWAIHYGVQTVRVHEGTTLAALTRHLLPAIVCLVAIVVVDLVTSYLSGYAALADATWIVGTTLVGAFLFTTAVAIRQQGGELERLYDWTTWRDQSLE